LNVFLHLCRPLLSIPFPSSSYFLPFPYPFLPLLSLITARQSVGALYIPPQRVRVEYGRQRHLCAIDSPKSANLLKVSPTCRNRNFHCNEKIIIFIFLAWNSGAPALGGRLDFAHSARPIATPLLLATRQRGQKILLRV